MHNTLQSHSSRAAPSPSHKAASGRKLTPAPLCLPGTETTKEGQGVPTREGGGKRNMSPQVSNTLGLRTCKPARQRMTTSPANPGGLIYIRPPRVSPPPTGPGVSPGARAQFWIAAEAASLLPFPAPQGRGWQTVRDPGPSGQRPGSRGPVLSRRLPGPLRGAGPQGRATGTGRAPRLAAARIARPESRAGGAERKWWLPLCTNHVRPAGECHPAPGAGRRAQGGHLDSHRVREPPSARQPPPNNARPWGAARSPEAPRPHTSPVP